MSQESQHTLRIVIHASGNAMTIRQEGMITKARAFKPGRLWDEAAQGGTTGSLSLEFCKETYLVLRKCLYVSARS